MTRPIILAALLVLVCLALIAGYYLTTDNTPDAPPADTRFPQVSPDLGGWFGQQKPDALNPPPAEEEDLTEKLNEAARAATVASGLKPGHRIYREWPRPVYTALLSPNKRTIAIYDGKGVFLADRHARHVRRLRTRLLENWASEQLTVTFAFRPDSARIAVLTALVYGEPLGAFYERLWTADVGTGRTRLLHTWSGRVQGAGPITADRRVQGWTAKGRSVIVVGVTYDGLEMPSDARQTAIETVKVQDKPVRRIRDGRQ